MDFEIEEVVIEIMSGDEYVIIANKETPRIRKIGEIEEELYPEAGCDYIIVKANGDENGFSPYKHIKKSFLDKRP